jgi:hypothetical protein
MAELDTRLLERRIAVTVDAVADMVCSAFGVPCRGAWMAVELRPYYRDIALASLAAIEES